jgi:hypothetical protein
MNNHDLSVVGEKVFTIKDLIKWYLKNQKYLRQVGTTLKFMFLFIPRPLIE